mmetsp:Transcript_3661/g.11610  ORF Transcript_3661/g.11610 Transcript_3661/m.11610 type:complete len:86 (-) Transcript_3661:228-485(-)
MTTFGMRSTFYDTHVHEQCFIIITCVLNRDDDVLCRIRMKIDTLQRASPPKTARCNELDSDSPLKPSPYAGFHALKVYPLPDKRT